LGSLLGSSASRLVRWYFPPGARGGKLDLEVGRRDDNLPRCSFDYSSSSSKWRTGRRSKFHVFCPGHDFERACRRGPVGFACCWDLRQSLMPPPVVLLPHQLAHTFRGVGCGILDRKCVWIQIFARIWSSSQSIPVSTSTPRLDLCDLGLVSFLPYLGVHQ